MVRRTGIVAALLIGLVPAGLLLTAAAPFTCGNVAKR